MAQHGHAALAEKSRVASFVKEAVNFFKCRRIWRIHFCQYERAMLNLPVAVEKTNAQSQQRESRERKRAGFAARPVVRNVMQL